MSLHSNRLKGQSERTKFMALSNGYHGETLFALSVSDLGLYKDPYTPLLTPTEFIKNIPYVHSSHDPLWNNCAEHWERIEKQLEPHAKTLSAILFEPILQGAGGMKIYSQDFLRRLRLWATKHDVHLIADEIMTGFGRTGKALACDHANIEPDFLCLSKGLTAGTLPMSAMLTSTNIYDLFYDDYDTGKAFLHSHTHTGNALAAAVALETLNIIDDENVYAHVNKLGKHMLKQMLNISEQTSLNNVRQIGAMVAADLESNLPRAGYQIYREAVKQGALLRPLGNTLYWCPPLNSSLELIDDLSNITLKALNS